MGFGKYNNDKQADLVHKIELFNPETGDPAITPDGRRQYIAVRGPKSRAYKNAVDSDQARMQRKGVTVTTTDQNIKRLASRMSAITVGYLIDIGDEAPEVIEAKDIESLPEEQRNVARAQIAELFSGNSDLCVTVNNEVIKEENFFPGRGQSLSSLWSNASGTAPSPTGASRLG